MVIRGKKKLALQIFYQSNQAQTHAPHGIYGPISVDAVYPYLQFVSSFVILFIYRKLFNRRLKKS